MLRKVMVAEKVSPAKKALADGLTVTLSPGCGAIDPRPCDAEWSVNLLERSATRPSAYS